MKNKLIITVIILFLLSACSKDNSVLNSNKNQLEYLGKKYTLSKAYQSYEGKGTVGNGNVKYHSFTIILASDDIEYNTQSGFESNSKGQIIALYLTTPDIILKSGTYREFKYLNTSQAVFDDIEIYFIEGLNNYKDYFCEDGELIIDVKKEKQYVLSFEGRDDEGNLLKFEYSGSIQEIIDIDGENSTSNFISKN